MKNVDEYIDRKLDQIDKFREFWKKQQQSQPDNFPQDKDTENWNEPEWDEQFEAYIETLYYIER